MCVTVAKVGQGRPKSRLQRLPHICHFASAKYERFYSLSYWHILELENRKVSQGVLTYFAKVKVTNFIYPVTKRL